MGFYATFEHQREIKEHFIGMLALSKEVGTSFSAANVFEQIVKYFEKLGVNLSKARYVCQDTTNVNSGTRGK